ncbi:hypothetical protein [Rothia halotolerans]|uniref:hypothetical protein n=1 Tax=Rothia halotolerans TaxID=405770 RepID=UPI00101D7E3E|nr:hypothetical protein [Rothia halotolerans]
MGSVHHRVVAGTGVVVFALLAVLSAVFLDLQDRAVPRTAGASAAFDLDFVGSALDEATALDALSRASDDLGLGLVRFAGNVRNSAGSDQVLVELSASRSLPDRLPRFGAVPDAEVSGSETLENSSPQGRYLVTGEHPDLPAFTAWLEENRVGAARIPSAAASVPGLLAAQPAFTACLVAALLLLVCLALYWWAVRARRRALLVLAGMAPRRIMGRDLAGLALPLTGSAGLVAAAATGFAATRGGVFVLPMVLLLGTLEALMVAGAVGTFALLSAVAWPSSAVLSRLRHAAQGHRVTATGLMALSFLLVVATVPPTAAVWRDAEATAREQAQWRLLTDQVSLALMTGATEEEFDVVSEPLGRLSRNADRRGAAAFSYAWEAAPSSADGDGPSPNRSPLALVSRAWLERTDVDDADLAPATRESLPVEAHEFLDEQLPLWTRSAPESLELYVHRGEAGPPLIEGGTGRMIFPRQPILVVVPDLNSFNDDSLGAAISSSNIVFTGLAATEREVREAGLGDAVRVQLVAEDGLLRAQLSSYLALITALSLVALTAALLVASAVGAAIAAIVSLPRDRVLGLSGESRWRIVAPRLVPQWAAGTVLTGVVYVVMGRSGVEERGWVWAGAALGLVIASASHLLATRWAFRQAAERAL